MHEGTWQRSDATDPMELTSDGGDRIALGAGRLWVLLLPDRPGPAEGPVDRDNRSVPSG
ncbi:hypothetical protein [Haloechinothrix alba]|uniref:hypothetical protein n=1 Tax=Haloechinothrix alba TaxID=664784 RepID=UPI003CCB8151